MADKTKIEWTRGADGTPGATWNPITGCTLVSEGCRNCYAAELAAGRLKHHPSREGLARRTADGTAKFTGDVRFNSKWLDQPLRWKRPRMIFTCAHGDLFHESVPNEWIDTVFAVMALAQRHRFQVLTKRPERMRMYLSDLETPARVYDAAIPMHRHANATPLRPVEDGLTPLSLPNVWLGVSVEDQAAADERIPHLLETPAAVRFISAEPLLGPVDLTQIDFRVHIEHLKGCKDRHEDDPDLRGSVLGTEGPRFESGRPDQKNQSKQTEKPPTLGASGAGEVERSGHGRATGGLRVPNYSRSALPGCSWPIRRARVRWAGRGPKWVALHTRRRFPHGSLHNRDLKVGPENEVNGCRARWAGRGPGWVAGRGCLASWRFPSSPVRQRTC